MNVERAEGPGMVGLLPSVPLEPRMPYPFLLFLHLRDGLVRKVFGFHPQCGLTGGVVQFLGTGVIGMLRLSGLRPVFDGEAFCFS